MDSEELRAALTRFTSSIGHRRHWSRAYYYTDGVAFLARHAGAQWLLDHIAARQKRARKDRYLRLFQIWHVRPVGEHKVRITCCRESGDAVFYDDVVLFDALPLEEIVLHFENDTLRLPCER